MSDLMQHLSENMLLRGQQEQIAGSVRIAFAKLTSLISGSASLGEERLAVIANAVLRKSVKLGGEYHDSLVKAYEEIKSQIERGEL